MKSPRAWVEEDILTLIRDREMESLTLEYKSCSSLSKTDDRIKTEISRDVSAFANAAGGVLIYGVVEKRREHLPEKIDEGFDPADINKDWLEQVINSRIHPRLDEYYIIPVELTSAHPGRVAYVVEIPQSVTRPPHQAHDHVYYRRYGSEVLAMEDYEIRDVMNRSRVPDLNIEIKREQSPEDGSGNVRLHFDHMESRTGDGEVCKLRLRSGGVIIPHGLGPIDIPEEFVEAAR